MLRFSPGQGAITVALAANYRQKALNVGKLAAIFA
jgi:hypothetical protein